MNKKLTNIFKHEFTLYWLLVIILFLQWQKKGLFRLETVPDSGTYNPEAFFSSIQTLFGGVRTFGYPLFLKVVSLFSPDFYFLPVVQFLFYVVVIFIFLIALKKYGFSRFQALIVAASLLPIAIIQDHVSVMLSETVAVTFAILTIAFVFMVISNPRNIGYWLGLATSLFLTYQTRPAFLFMIPAVPLIGWALVVLKKSIWKWNWQNLKIGLQFLGISFVPFFAFTLFRVAIVGHFGVVSFEGYNLSGLLTGSEVLTEEISLKLPSEQKTLARAILDRREALKTEMSSEEADKKYGFNILRKDCYKLPPPLTLRYLLSEERYNLWESCYNENCWTIAVGAANQLYGSDPIIVNDRLRTISLMLIKLKPNLYLTWLLIAFKKALLSAIIWEMSVNSFLFYPIKILLIVLIFNLILYILRIIHTRFNKHIFHRIPKIAISFIPTILSLIILKTIEVTLSSQYIYIVGFLFWIGITFLSVLAFISRFCYRELISDLLSTNKLISTHLSVLAIMQLILFVGGVCLVILVEPPLPRYIQAVSILLMAIVSLAILDYSSLAWKQLKKLDRILAE